MYLKKISAQNFQINILEQIIKDSNLRKVFFPNVSNDAAKFRNHVKENELDASIDIRRIETFIKSLKTVQNK